MVLGWKKLIDFGLWCLGAWVPYGYEITGSNFFAIHKVRCFHVLIHHALILCFLGALLHPGVAYAQIQPFLSLPSSEIESSEELILKPPAESEMKMIHIHRLLSYRNLPLPIDAIQVVKPQYDPIIIGSAVDMNQKNFFVRMDKPSRLQDVSSYSLSTSSVLESEAKPKICLEMSPWVRSAMGDLVEVRAGDPITAVATIDRPRSSITYVKLLFLESDGNPSSLRGLISGIPDWIEIPAGKYKSSPLKLQTHWDGRDDLVVLGGLVGKSFSNGFHRDCLCPSVVIYHGAPTLSVSPNPVDDGNPVTITTEFENTVSSDQTIHLVYPNEFNDSAWDRYHYKQLKSITVKANATEGTGTIPTYEFSGGGQKSFDVGIHLARIPILGNIIVQKKTVTIIDNEHPEVSFKSAESNSDEDSGSEIVALTIDPAPETALTVNYRLGGTATLSTDYEITKSGTVTVPKDSTSAEIPITILDDNEDEPDETVILTLSDGGSAYALGSIIEHTLTITDNDTSAVSFAVGTSTVQEDKGIHNVTLTIDPAPAKALTVKYAVDGTATEGADYSIPHSGNVTVPKDSTSVKIPISIIKDDPIEQDETIVLTLTDGGDAYNLGSIQIHTLTITEPDPSEIQFALDKSVVEEGTNEPQKIELTINPAPPAELTVNYRIADQSTAIVDVDYSITNLGTVTIPVGETSVDIPINIVDDQANELQESVIFTLAAHPSYTLGSIQEHTLTITDDDIPAVGFVKSTSVANEDKGTHNVALTIDPAPATELIVTYTLEDTDNAATEGIDFSITTLGTVTLPSGKPSVNIPVVIRDDNDDEKNETVTLVLTDDDGAYEIKNHRRHQVLILDDDESEVVPVNVTLSASPEKVTEGEIVTLTVTLSEPLSNHVDISLKDTPGVPPTDSKDYGIIPTIRVDAGERTGSGTVKINDDDISEGDEQFTVALDVLPEGTDRGSPFSVNIMIQDNAPLPVEASLTVSPKSVDEGQTVEVTALITNKLETDITIPLIYDDQTQYPPESGDYTPLEDITIVSGQITGSGQIRTHEDKDDDNEEFTVSIENMDSEYWIPSENASETVTIQDTRTSLRVDLSNAPSDRVSEGNQVTITATLTESQNEPVTIPLILVNETTSDEDYVAPDPRVIEIAAGSTSGSYVISTTYDDVDEGEFEIFIVSMDETQLPSDLEVGNSSVEVRITDDDDAAINADLRVTVTEGKQENIEIALNSRPLINVTVNITANSNSALSFSPPVLQFTPENWGDTQPVVLDAQDNQIVGENDPVTLTLTTNGYTSAPHNIGVIILDNDTPGIDIRPSSLTIEEGDTKSLMVALLKAPSDHVTVTIPGSEKNLTVNKKTLEFTPDTWRKHQEIKLTAQPLDEDEESKTVTLFLTGSGGGYDDTNHTVPVTIIEKPPPPIPTLSISDNSATGTNGEIQMHVTLEPASQKVVTVEYETSDDTATDGKDYVASRGIMIFDAGATSGVIQIMLNKNDNLDGDKSFKVTLSNPRNAIVRGDGVGIATIRDKNSPASLTISDAWVVDSEAFVQFVVTVSEPQSMPVSVEYRTQDVTATGGEDYEPQAGLVTLAPGKVEAVIAVPLLKAGTNWKQESFAVHLISSENAQITKSVGVATTQNSAEQDMHVLTAYTTRFVRSSSVQIVEALQQRFRSDGNHSVCGAQERAEAVRMYGGNSSWNPSLGELLSGCHMSGSTTTSSGQFSVWGRGAFQQFQGHSDDALTLRGEVTTGMLGVDYQWNQQESTGNWLVGMLVSQSHGDGSFDRASESGNLAANLTRVHPYISYSGNEWLVWLSGGYGWGNVQQDALKRDLTSRFGALGMHAHLTSIDAVRLSYHGDVLLTDAKVQAQPIQEDVIRVRVGMEGAFQILQGVQPYVEANVRQDGGDAETGLGLELGAGVRMNYPAWHLKADLYSQRLVLHTADGFTEWGFSGSVQLGRRSEGLMVLLRPSWGPAQTMSLYHQRTILDPTPSDQATYRTDLELGYGMPWKSTVVRSVMGVTQLPYGRLLRLGGELSPWNQARFSISALGYHQQLSVENVSFNVQGSLIF